MRIGCYSPELLSLRDEKPTLQAALKAVDTLFAKAVSYGYEAMQFNFLSVLGEEMPASYPAPLLAAIKAKAKETDITLISVNGTFNMVHPDEEARLEGIQRFAALTQAAHELEIPIITLCTGSRSRKGMWAVDPDNDTEESYQLLLRTTQAILPMAQKYGLILGVEIEASNVIFTAKKALRYLTDMGGNDLKIIMDCANLFPAGTGKVENVRPVIEEAFTLLRDKICLAHGKDILPSDTPKFTNPTEGMIDYPFFKAWLDQISYQGPMILHGFHGEEPMPGAIARIREIF